MTARLGKHFLRRLRHNAEAAVLDRAVGAGILVDEVRIIDGRKIRLFTPHLTMLEKSEAELARLLFRLGGTVKGSRSQEAFMEFEDEDGLSQSGVVLSPSKRGSAVRPASSKKRGGTGAFRTHHLDLRTSLLRRIRRTIEPPRAAEVATLLMLAQAVDDDPAALAEMLRILKLPQPIITVVGKVKGFEDCFLDLLCSGMVLPGKVAVASGHEIHRDGSIRFGRDEDIRWRAVAFTGRWFDPDAVDKTDWRVGQAAMSAFPILGAAEHENRLPERLRRAAQLSLVCGPLNGTIIGDTMTAVLGEEAMDGLGQVDCSLLTLSDLAIAIRPGVSIVSAWEVLEHIARERRRSAEAGEGTDGGRGSASSSSSKTQASNATKTGRGKDQGSGSEIIQPAKLTGGEQDRFIPRIETLTGYGEARGWSLSLQADLALWREGKLAWDEMTTKLLLAGPPGTGKTSFAKALCNTLQIPLIVTSVATWLEPAYLGDVLRRMKAAFTEAEAHKPSILFVDEIDGIGKRENASRSYDEYWTSFINQALTLLDGASKSSGVIVVGATNNPGAIDPALLRSGRLEKHIVIPRPDTEALIGILRHHLRADLDGVIASAPTWTSTWVAAASVSGPEVESAQASIASEGRATGPKRDAVVTDPVDDEAPVTSPQVTARQARANKHSRRDA